MLEVDEARIQARSAAIHLCARLPQQLAPFAQHSLVHFEEFTAELVKCLRAHAPNAEVATVLRSLLHFNQTVAFDEVGTALLAGTHRELAHGPIQVRVQLIVNEGVARVNHKIADAVRHAQILHAWHPKLGGLTREAQIEQNLRKPVADVAISKRVV